MDPKLFEIQRQIKENSMSISDYLKDLHEWEKEINSKDKILKTQSKGIKANKENSKNLQTETKNESKSQIENNKPGEKNFKRDKNSIKDYYDAWNKIDIDNEELIEKEESQIVTNRTEDTIQKEFFTNPKKISTAKPNTSIKIKNNRQGLLNQEGYVEKIKTEANAYFAMGNYNKTIELNSAILKFIDEQSNNLNEDVQIKMKIAISNNRGNSHLKLGNYKEAIKDFNYVVENDKNNIKAYFRRGLSYYKMQKFIKAIEDLQIALDLSEELEKNSISPLIKDSLNEINVIISNQKLKMEKFEYSESTKYTKLISFEFNKENFNNLECSNIDIRRFLENLNESKDKNINGVNQTNNENVKSNSNNLTNNKTYIINSQVSQNILSNEEIRKFVYDLTKENLTSSSFKLAFRNFDDNLKEKEEFLLKVNPGYLPKIFVNDMDKNILIEILNCLKSILNRKDDQ